MLTTYAAERQDLDRMAADFFRRVETGQVRIDIHQRYALEDAAQAHRDLEAGQTTGSSILIP
jgi:NADPH2:quinone reductase